MSNPQVSQSEIEAMRRIVADADKMHQSVNFDLNNPPKKPYVHQDFPRVVYQAGEHKVVNDAVELAEALADGYSKSPDADPVPEKPKQGRKAKE